MSNPADNVNPIPRNQFALFVRGPDGEPIDKLIQDLEIQQQLITSTTPEAIVTAQQTADSAVASAGVANTKLNGESFVTINNDSAQLGQSRRLAAGQGLKFTDGGAGNTAAYSLLESIALLNADVFDITAAFVNAGNLLGALEANSTYVVDGMLTFQSAGAGVGIGLAFALPAGASMNGGYSHNATPTGAQSAYNNAPTTVNANTTAVPVINTNIPITGRWIIRTGITAGAAQLQFRSGAAATQVTLKQTLSTLVFKKIG